MKSLDDQRCRATRYDFFGDEFTNSSQPKTAQMTRRQSVSNGATAAKSLSRSEVKTLIEVSEIADSKNSVKSKKGKWVPKRLVKISAISAIGVQAIFALGASPAAADEVDESSPVNVTVESEQSLTIGDGASVSGSQSSSTKFSGDGTIETTKKTNVEGSLEHESGPVGGGVSVKASDVEQVTIDPGGNATRGEGNSIEGNANVTLDAGRVELEVEVGGSATNLDLEGTSIDRAGNVVTVTGTSEEGTLNGGLGVGVDVPENPVVGGDINLGVDVKVETKTTETVQTNSGEPGQEIFVENETTSLGVNISAEVDGNVGIYGESGSIAVGTNVVNVDNTDSTVTQDGAAEIEINSTAITVGPVELESETKIDVSGPNDIITVESSATAPGVELVDNFEQVVNEDGVVVQKDEFASIGGFFFPDEARGTEFLFDPGTGTTQNTTTDTTDGLVFDTESVVQTTDYADGSQIKSDESSVAVIGGNTQTSIDSVQTNPDGSSTVSEISQVRNSDGLLVNETRIFTSYDANGATAENSGFPEEFQGPVLLEAAPLPAAAPADTFSLGTIDEYGPVTDIAVYSTDPFEGVDGYDLGGAFDFADAYDSGGVFQASESFNFAGTYSSSYSSAVVGFDFAEINEEYGFGWMGNSDPFASSSSSASFPSYRVKPFGSSGWEGTDGL